MAANAVNARQCQCFHGILSSYWSQNGRLLHPKQAATDMLLSVTQLSRNCGSVEDRCTFTAALYEAACWGWFDRSTDNAGLPFWWEFQWSKLFCLICYYCWLGRCSCLHLGSLLRLIRRIDGRSLDLRDSPLVRLYDLQMKLTFSPDLLQTLTLHGPFDLRPKQILQLMHLFPAL